MAEIEQWFQAIPPVTRAWFIASAGTSVLVYCQAIAPLQLYFSWNAAVLKAQPWRFITTFCYFGKISFNLAFNLFFVMRYSRLLEEHSFMNRRADYVWLLMLTAGFLLAVSPFVNMPFLASPLSFALVYIWARRNPSVKMSLFGIVTIPASYIPFCLAAFSWLLQDNSQGDSQAALGDVLGILAGHTYVFLQDYWPREMWTTTPEGAIRTPRILKRIFGQTDPEPEPAPEAAPVAQPAN